MIPDPSGQLAELIVQITSTRVDLYSHQILLDGLLKLCFLNLKSANEIKTKSMVVGNKNKARINLTFNEMTLDTSTKTNVLVSLFVQ